MRTLPVGLLLLTFGVLTAPLAAQEGAGPAMDTLSSPLDLMTPAISGMVRTAYGTGQPARVMVKLETLAGSLVAQVWTASSGSFAFYRIPRGNYNLVVDSVGYKPVRLSVQFDPAPLAGILIDLEPDRDDSQIPPGASVSLRQLSVPEKARRESKKAEEALAKQQVEKGIAHYRKAIEIFPDYDDAYVQLALAYLKLGRHDDAKAVARSAIARNEKNAQAYALLGVAFRERREFAEAEAALQQSLKLEELSWFAHLELGRTFLRQRKYEEGYQHVDRAHELNPGVPSIHLTYYNTLVLRKDYTAAAAELEEFLQLFPQHHLAAKAREQRKALQGLQESLTTNQP